MAGALADVPATRGGRREIELNQRPASEQAGTGQTTHFIGGSYGYAIGMRPHLRRVPSRSPLSGEMRTARNGRDGAMLNRGSKSGRDFKLPMSSAIIARLVLSVKR